MKKAYINKMLGVVAVAQMVVLCGCGRETEAPAAQLAAEQVAGETVAAQSGQIGRAHV